VLETYRDCPKSLSIAFHHLARFVLLVQMGVYLNAGVLELYELSTFAYHLKEMRRGLTNNDAWHLTDFGRFLRLKKNNCFRGMYDFIVEHTKPYVELEATGHLGPSNTSAAALEALEWVLSCAWHSGIILSYQLQQQLEVFRERQPVWVQPKKGIGSNYFEQRYLRLAGGSGTRPALTQALLPFAASDDQEGVIIMVTKFLRMAYIAAKTFAYEGPSVANCCMSGDFKTCSPSSALI
jgi:hypothetical protein